MGLSTKQVSGDQGIDDGQTMQHFDAAELSKPPVRRQQQQQHSEASKCPRCESSNTKFCYYNNYNKSQPRHFCKSCKRHWTKGGTLRNVPLGGGRKNKRPKISNATNTAATSTIDDQKPTSSSGFYQADLIGHDQPFLGSDKGVINNNNTTTTSATTTCLNESAQPQNSIAEFQYFSSVSTNIDTNGSLFPVSYQSLNVYDQYSCNLDSMEESTITTVNIPTTSNVPWTGKDNSTMDLSNYWDWNEIDVITSSDHFNLSWDDEEIDGGAKIKP